MLDRWWANVAGVKQADRGRRALRPRVDGLELRQVMATLAPIANVSAPVGLGSQVALDGGSGAPQTYSVTSDNPNVTVTPSQGKFWTVGVSHASSGANDPAFSGTMTFQLFQDLTPLTVSRITELIQNGFYTSPTQPTDGSAPLPHKNFHRIVDGFVAQGGSLTGNGTGSYTAPGFPFTDEFNQQLVFNTTGQLAMANAGDDTNDTQFFVTYAQTRNLDFNHTIFGQIVSGQDILAKMQTVAKTGGGENSVPVSPILITSTTLSDQNPDAVLHVNTTRSQIGQTANVTVKATDPSDGSTATRTFQVQVVANTDANGQPLNEPAFLQPMGNLTVATNQPAIFRAVSVNPEPTDTLTYVVNGGTQTTATGKQFIPLQNATGSVDANGVVTVTPATGFTGTINVQVGVRDDKVHSGRPSDLNSPDAFDTERFTITVQNGAVVTLRPIAAPSTLTIGTGLSQSIQLTGQTANPGTPNRLLRYELTDQPRYGTITNFNADTGTLTYTPNAGFLGNDQFGFTVTESGGTGPTLTALPATVSLIVSTADTNAVRVVDGVLLVTPPPRTDRGTNVIAVNRVGSNIQVTVNGVIDQLQPAVSSIDRIVVYGAKASDQITVSNDLTIPATLNGGQGGRNILQAGGGPSRLHGWYGLNRMTGGPATDALIGRVGHVKFRPSGGNDRAFAGQANPGRRLGQVAQPGFLSSVRAKPPTGTFYRFVNGRLVKVPTPGPSIEQANVRRVSTPHVPARLSGLRATDA